MASNNLQHNDMVVDALRQAIRAGDAGLKDVPALVEKVLAESCWVKREVHQIRREVEFKDFVDFIQSYPPEGLGTDYPTLQRLCKGTKAEDLLDQAIQGKQGNPTGNNQHKRGNFDNVQDSSAPTGNSRTSALRRLRKDRPDLHAQVLEKKLSPHAAMLQAGFRREPTTVEKMQKLWLKMTPEEKEQFQIWATEQLCG
jgi:hypothetical protein